LVEKIDQLREKGKSIEKEEKMGVDRGNRYFANEKKKQYEVLHNMTNEHRE